MFHVLSAIVPIMLIVALGYVLTRAGMFSRTDLSAMSRFVVKVALPLLVFVNVAGQSAAEIFQPTYLLTYAVVAAVMFAVAALYARVVGRTPVRAAFMGMGMGGTNNGFIGFPLFLILLADHAGAAVGMAMIVDNVFIIPFTLFLAEQAVGEGSVAHRLRQTVRNVLLHPMVLAIIAALVLNALGLHLPQPVSTSVELLASTSSGLALFVIGGLLVGLQLRGSLTDITVTVVGKLLAAPALGLGLILLLPAFGLPELDPPLRAAAVLLCALPTFSIVPSMAEPYGESDVTAASMMLQTVLSFLTLSGWMVALTAVGWL